VSLDEAFLQEICDHPDDDAPRLVYADWLEEHGDGDRAEFIRTQCELARLGADDPRRPGLEAREGALLERHGPRWARPVAGLVARWRFARGFVESVTMAPGPFLTQHETLFRLAPVRAVAFYNAAGVVADLGACPALRRLSTVAFSGTSFPGGGEGHGMVLSLAGDQGTYIGDAGARALAASPYIDQLNALYLVGNALTAVGARALAASPHLAGLTHLDLYGNGLGLSLPEYLSRTVARFFRAVGPGGVCAAVQALIASPYLTRLTWLNLRGNRLGEADRQALRTHFGDAVLV
jgi:uncharacterized protein (TIGR02996 family)